MKARILFLAVCSVLVFMLMGGAAFASYPHGNFADNPDACAACHRMHTATGRNLIKDASGGTCLSCHNNGIAADTDVMNGVYLDDRDAEPHHPAWGANLGILMGGGFTKVGNATGTSSKHRVDETLIPPGADPATGFPYGAAIQLRCTSCHTAHPNKNYPDQYRLLALRPNNVGVDKIVVWNGPWADATQKAHLDNGYRAYTEADFSADNPVTDPKTPGHAGEKETTRNYQSGIAAWCAACHTHYMAEWTPGAPGTPNEYKTNDPYAAGDQFAANPRERHSVNTILWHRVAINGTTYDCLTDVPLEDKTGDGRTEDDWLTCMSCHRAHGSDTVVAASLMPIGERQAAAAVLPYGSDSMLLRGGQGRKICADCHNF